MDEIKMMFLTVVTVAVAFTVGYITGKSLDTWQAVEVARLRCAPSAAPAGSAP
jgi:hypothetical protein